MKDYIKRELNDFKRFCKNKDNQKKLLLFILVSAIMGIIFCINNNKTQGMYITDKDGNIVGIYNKDFSKDITFPLILEVKKGNKKIKKEILLNIKGEESNNSKKEKRMSNDKSKYDMEAELSRIASDVKYEIEKNHKKKLMLPKVYNKNYFLKWGRVRNKDLLKFFCIPLILFLILYFDIRRKKHDEIRERRDSIIKYLPGFCDQLLIMIQCGLIFPDAFNRIAEEYSKEENKNYFKELIMAIRDKSKLGNRGIGKIFYEESISIGNKSLSRLANLVMNNQKKGVDITYKLKEDIEVLRENRKQAAIEKGKLAESKLTMPLAMLLIVLIIVTAAPALLQVKGV